MTASLIVQSIEKVGAGERRFTVIRFDPKGPSTMGPDGGKGHAGYTEAELRIALAEIYELPEHEINSLIEGAKTQSKSG